MLQEMHFRYSQYHDPYVTCHVNEVQQAVIRPVGQPSSSDRLQTTSACKPQIESRDELDAWDKGVGPANLRRASEISPRLSDDLLSSHTFACLSSPYSSNPDALHFDCLQT